VRENTTPISERPVSEPDLLTLAAAMPVARLATVGVAGAIDVVPITFAWSGSTIVTAVDHKRKRSRRLRRLDNIAREPRVTVLIDHYADDWSTLWWVRVRGSAVVLEDGPRVVAAVDALVAKYPQHYGDQPPAGPVIAIEIGDIRTWRAS
jgi:PPOX class probable F420-dependent enzyme